MRQRIRALESFLADVYGAGEILDDGVVSAAAGDLVQPLPPGGVRARAAQRRPDPRGGHRPDPRRAGRLPRARGQPALPERRLLRAREPAHARARAARGVRRPPGAVGRGVPRASARRAACGCAVRRRRPDGRGADAGRAQLGALRARVPRAPDGRRARRGSRPVLPRRPALDAHGARARGRSTWSTAASTTSTSTRCTSSPTRCSAYPACSTPRARATSRSPTRSATASPTTRPIYPYVPAMIEYYLGETPMLPNVETYDLSDPDQRAHVLAASRPHGGQAGRRLRRLRPGDRHVGHREAAARHRGRHRGRPARVDRAADRHALDLPDDGRRTPPSSRATSTSGRSR